MSTLEVNKLAPLADNGTVTLGDSGDTITIPTGAGLTVTDEIKTNKISPATGTAFTLGDSGDTFTIPSGATITNNGTASGFGGITEMDSWRITSDFTGNQTPISSNWERVDSYNWSKLGTGLSQSSGVFSMPSTGFWLILARQQVVNTGSNHQAGLALQVTNDNSSYNTVIDAPSSTAAAGS